MARVEKLHYITQGKTQEEIMQEVVDVISGGCRWIQLRMKESDKDDIVETAKLLKPICKRADAILLINDSVDICIESDADGVHLGREDMPLIEARAILGDDKIIGRTCNTVADVRGLIGSSVDYIGAGPLRFTTTKKALSPIIGIEGYDDLVALSDIPIIAIGGILTSDIPELLARGVYGIAISGTIYNSESRAETTSQFIELISSIKN